jgi:hypothetical protein
MSGGAPRRASSTGSSSPWLLFHRDSRGGGQGGVRASGADFLLFSTEEHSSGDYHGDGDTAYDRAELQHCRQ